MQDSPTNTLARRAELILHELSSLPTLPSIAMRLMRVGSADDADLKEIIRLIEADPVLTARILSFCRRAELGLGTRVTTVERAVILLGLETLQSIVLGVEVVAWSQSFSSGNSPQVAGKIGPPHSDASIPEAIFDRTGFWCHCIGVACCAELIANKHRDLGVSPSEAFVTGLLHDLGKLALNAVLPQAYQRVIGLAEHRQTNIADIERSVIGIDHHTAGKRLAERWELPPLILDSIWLHGQQYGALPDSGTDSRKIVGIVGIADAICRGLHLGWSGNHSQVEPVKELCRPMGLDAKKIEQSLPWLLETVAQRCADLGLSDEPSERMVINSLGAANRRLSKLSDALERRARLADSQSRVMDEVSAFLARVRPEKGPIETLSRIVESAATLLGEGRYLVVFDEGGGRGGGGAPADSSEKPAWIMLTFSADGKRTGSRIVEIAPRTSLTPASLMKLDAAQEVLCSSSGAAMSLLSPENAPGDAAFGASLVHDREDAMRALGRKSVSVLAAAWGQALSSSLREEAAARLGEQLAEANRTLAQTQRTLADVQSMARLAELTAGAAHEFNNPLAIISGRGQMLQSTVVDPQQKVAAAAMMQAARQLSDLIQRLHAVARPPVPSLGPVKLSEVLDDAVRRASARAPRKNAQGKPIPIRVSISDRVPLARFGPRTLYAVPR